MTTVLTELDARYSVPAADVQGWADARDRWQRAEVYWLSTVRPDGRPHVTPLISVWLNDGAYFCTGPTERKAKNVSGNPHVAMTTGSNALGEGMDLVLEGIASEINDHDELHLIADEYVRKYGADWQFEVRDGAFFGEGGRALVFGVAPQKAFGFVKGEYSQTRWRFVD